MHMYEKNIQNYGSYLITRFKIPFVTQIDAELAFFHAFNSNFFPFREQNLLSANVFFSNSKRT